MGLKLTVGRGDLVLLSGGFIVFVDQLDVQEASFLLVNEKGETIRRSMSDKARGAQTVFPGASFSVEAIYFSEKIGRGQVKLNFVAPKKVKIHRLHKDDREERITEILAHFDGSDDLDGLVKNIKKIAPKVLH